MLGIGEPRYIWQFLQSLRAHSIFSTRVLVEDYVLVVKHSFRVPPNLQPRLGKRGGDIFWSVEMRASQQISAHLLKSSEAWQTKAVEKYDRESRIATYSSCRVAGGEPPGPWPVSITGIKIPLEAR